MLGGMGTAIYSEAPRPDDAATRSASSSMRACRPRSGRKPRRNGSTSILRFSSEMDAGSRVEADRVETIRSSASPGAHRDRGPRRGRDRVQDQEDRVDLLRPKRPRQQSSASAERRGADPLGLEPPAIAHRDPEESSSTSTPVDESRRRRLRRRRFPHGEAITSTPRWVTCSSTAYQPRRRTRESLSIMAAMMTAPGARSTPTSVLSAPAAAGWRRLVPTYLQSSTRSPARVGEPFERFRAASSHADDVRTRPDSRSLSDRRR